MTEAQLDANLSTGVVVAFANIFDAHFHCGWLVYVIAFLLAARRPGRDLVLDRRPVARAARDRERGHHPA